jgi:hypothetical protein
MGLLLMSRKSGTLGGRCDSCEEMRKLSRESKLEGYVKE